MNGRIAHKFMGTKAGCGLCELRAQCLHHPQRTEARQVAMFVKGQPGAHVATELMKRAINSARGRSLYSQRIATVEPVFANLRQNKRLDRFTVRGKEKVGTHWRLYYVVHNIENPARNGYRDERKGDAPGALLRLCESGSGWQNHPDELADAK